MDSIIYMMHYKQLKQKTNKFNRNQKKKNKSKQNLQTNIQEKSQHMGIVKFIQKKISSYVIAMKRK